MGNDNGFEVARSAGVDARVAAWWDAVLAGDNGEPHPIFGSDVSARIKDGCLVLSGTLLERSDREQLARQARSRIGRGFHDVDASRLRVADRTEKKGLLDQVLIAAYPDAGTARRACKFVVEHSRVKTKRDAILDPGAGDIAAIVPAEYLGEARKHLSRGESLVVLRVDETDAFRVRELMDEDTRSSWTLAVPPEHASADH